jgi:hypothetical protein
MIYTMPAPAPTALRTAVAVAENTRCLHCQAAGGEMVGPVTMRGIGTGYIHHGQCPQKAPAVAMPAAAARVIPAPVVTRAPRAWRACGYPGCRPGNCDDCGG